MNKLFTLLFLASVTAASALENATVLAVIPFASVTTTNNSTNYSAGPVYVGTNTTPINATFNGYGKTLFLAQGFAGTGTNIVVRLQDSPDNTNYTTRATAILTNTSAQTIAYDLNTLAKFWRVQVVNTNGSPTVVVNGIALAKYQ